MTVAFLHGDRVALRPFEREDLPLLQRSRNDPGIREPLTFSTPSNADDVEEFYDAVMQGDDNVNLVVQRPDEDDGTDACRADAGRADAGRAGAGVVTLFDVSRHAAELAYWILPAFHGEGFGTEAAALLVDHAFQGMGLHRLRAKALVDNDASRAVLDRLGFRDEGRSRDAVFQRGAYRDHVRYGLLEGEWDGVDGVL